eukprot:c53108_g1_i1.p1 GENE.c53108_g1_i1~~c53108_g1_i1.p1  ORF type:complete len:180 (+),score=36.86 c53108_g1_i1:28-540(+)
MSDEKAQLRHNQMEEVSPPSQAGRKIAVFVDGSSFSQRAFDRALAIKEPHDSLIIAHCCAPREILVAYLALACADSSIKQEHMESLQEHGNQIIQAHLKICQDRGLQGCDGVVLTCQTSPEDTACEFLTEQEVNLVVVGNRGLSVARRLLLGSFSTHLLNHGPCDVLVVR